MQMFKVGDRIVGKAAGPSFFRKIAGKHGLIVKVDVHNLIGPYLVRFDDPKLGTGTLRESDLDPE